MHVVSKLGRDLRRISDKIAASGEKPLTPLELEREIAANNLFGSVLKYEDPCEPVASEDWDALS